MTDLVQRLRGNGGTVDIPDIMHEAADEIERLRLLVGVKCTEDVARLRDALETAIGELVEYAKSAHFDYGTKDYKEPETITNLRAVLALPHTGQPREKEPDIRIEVGEDHPHRWLIIRLEYLVGLAGNTRGGSSLNGDAKKLIREAIERLSAAPASPQRAEGE